MEQIIERKTVQIEQKRIVLELCQNYRGLFVRIIEEQRLKKHHVMIPMVALDGVGKILMEFSGREVCGQDGRTGGLEGRAPEGRVLRGEGSDTV